MDRLNRGISANSDLIDHTICGGTSSEFDIEDKSYEDSGDQMNSEMGVKLKKPRSEKVCCRKQDISNAPCFLLVPKNCKMCSHTGHCKYHKYELCYDED